MSYLSITFGIECRENISIGDEIEINVSKDDGSKKLKTYKVKKLEWIRDGVKAFLDKK